MSGIHKSFTPEGRVFDLASAVKWRESLRGEDKRLVLTNGCFDLIHRGHVEYLSAARSFGDALIVLLNSDESVRTLKGPLRPLNCETDRAYVLASLRMVDAVTVFSSATCTDHIKALKPDIYVKGGDYTLETINKEEKTALLEAGSDIRFIPFVGDFSTTKLLAGIDQQGGDN